MVPQLCSKCVDPHTHTHSEVRASLAPGCAGLTCGLPGLLNVAWRPAGLIHSTLALTCHRMIHTALAPVPTFANKHPIHFSSTHAAERPFEDREGGGGVCWMEMVLLAPRTFFLVYLLSSIGAQEKFF